MRGPVAKKEAQRCAKLIPLNLHLSELQPIKLNEYNEYNQLIAGILSSLGLKI